MNLLQWLEKNSGLKIKNSKLPTKSDLSLFMRGADDEEKTAMWEMIEENGGYECLED